MKVINPYIQRSITVGGKIYNKIWGYSDFSLGGSQQLFNQDFLDKFKIVVQRLVPSHLPLYFENHPNQSIKEKYTLSQEPTIFTSRMNEV